MKNEPDEYLDMPLIACKITRPHAFSKRSDYATRMDSWSLALLLIAGALIVIEVILSAVA